MKTKVVLLLTVLLAFCGCGNEPQGPVYRSTTQSEISLETDTIWTSYGVPDTITVCEKYPSKVYVGNGPDIKETFTDILKGDTANLLTISFSYVLNDNGFEPYEVEGYHHQTVMINSPFFFINFMIHAQYDSNGKIMPMYFSSSIAPYYYGSILCNYKVHLYSYGVSYSSAAGYPVSAGVDHYDIGNATINLQRAEGNDYRLECKFSVLTGPNWLERFYYYEYVGPIEHFFRPKGQ